MDERYFIDKLSAYLDNELPPDERIVVDEYIRAHPEAQRQLKELELLGKLSAAKSTLGGSDIFWEQKARAIERAVGSSVSRDTHGAEQSAFGRHWWKFTAVAASAAILFFVATRKDEIVKQALPQIAPQVGIATDSVQNMTAETPTEPITLSPPETATSEVATRTTISQKPSIAKPAQPSPNVDNKVADALVQKSAAPETVSASEDAMALSDAVPEAHQPTLNEWLSVRDSLAPVIASLEEKSKSPIARVFKTPMTTSLQESKKSSPDSRVLSWLEVNYHIASLSGDMSQRVAAIDALQKYASSPDSTIRASAEEYLEQLLKKK